MKGNKVFYPAIPLLLIIFEKNCPILSQKGNFWPIFAIFGSF